MILCAGKTYMWDRRALILHPLRLYSESHTAPSPWWPLRKDTALCLISDTRGLAVTGYQYYEKVKKWSHEIVKKCR